MNDIFIRSLDRDDLLFLYRLYSDVEACRASGARPAESIVRAQQYLEKHLEMKNCFVIVLKETMQPVGIVYCTQDIHRINRKAFMLSYKLERNHWGKGYMTQAVKLMLKYLFLNNGADIVAAAHFVDNSRSKRVLEKCGFVYEGTLRREFTHWDGRILDSCMYSMTYDEYEQKRKQLTIKG